MSRLKAKLSGEIWRVESSRHILEFPISYADCEDKAIEVALSTNRMFEWETPIVVTKEFRNGSS